MRLIFSRWLLIVIIVGAIVLLWIVAKQRQSTDMQVGIPADSHTDWSQE